MSFVYDIAVKCTRYKEVSKCFDKALEESKSLLPSQAEELFQTFLGLMLEKQISQVYDEFIRVRK